ncbi:MAG TPA: N-formylglutamate amidohydrolase, partial [Casimicrobiaceae bacterium]
MTSRRVDRFALLVTCEHGGNRVPPAYRRWFKSADNALASHRGFDAGALSMARGLAQTLNGDLLFTTVSRLVVELNRSLRHPQLFSSFVRVAPEAVRREIFERYYVPYWRAAQAAVDRALRDHARVVHIGSHSFSPVLDGHRRTADIGLLYDPARLREASLCARWREALWRRSPQWTVRRNYPYAGKNDGLTTALRRRYSPSRYLGIELEINQLHPLGRGATWHAMQRTVIAALSEALAAETPNRRE